MRKPGMWYAKALLRADTTSLSTDNTELYLSLVLLGKSYGQVVPLSLCSRKSLTVKKHLPCLLETESDTDPPNSDSLSYK